jgi:hypothetical protein
MVRYLVPFDKYQLTNLETKLLMVCLGFSTGYMIHIFFEILKNRKNSNSNELPKQKQKDPKFNLKSVRGGDISNPDNLYTFDPEEEILLKFNLFKAIKAMKGFNRVKKTKDRAIQCFEYLNSKTARINNRQLINLILKSLGLSLTNTDILAITPALLAVIIMNGGFSKVYLENMSNNVPLKLKQYSDYLKALMKQQKYLQVFNVIIAPKQSDIFLFIVSAALSYFAYSSRIGWLIGLLKKKAVGSLIGFMVLVFRPMNTCFEFAIPMVPYTIEIPVRENFASQRGYKMIPGSQDELRDIEDLPKIFVTTSPSLIVDNKEFSRGEIRNIQRDWDKDPGGLMKMDYPREIQETKTLNLEILRTGDVNIDSKTYKKFIDYNEGKLPLQLEEKNLINNLKSKRVFKESSNIKTERKYNKKIHGLHEVQKNKATNFNDDQIMDVEFEKVTPKVREKNT